MRNRRIILVGAAGLVVAGLLLAGQTTADTGPKAAEVRKALALEKRLTPLGVKLAAPSAGDWRAGPGRAEKQQTLSAYLRSNPTRPTKRRRTIYLQPIGTFSAAEKKVVETTAEYLRAFYQLPVKLLDPLGAKVIPAAARRKNPYTHQEQWLSTYILDKILKPRLPKDAMVLTGITATDLWPGEGWNFVFGQASLRSRVGVQSIWRNGKLDGHQAERQQFLRRTLQTASHEMGHVISIRHETVWRCNLCGSNHRAEADSQPMWLCPPNVAKLCYAVGCNPVKRFRDLYAFCKKHGFTAEATHYAHSLKALGAAVPTSQPTK